MRTIQIHHTWICTVLQFLQKFLFANSAFSNSRLLAVVSYSYAYPFMSMYFGYEATYLSYIDDSWSVKLCTPHHSRTHSAISAWVKIPFHRRAEWRRKWTNNMAFIARGWSPVLCRNTTSTDDDRTKEMLTPLRQLFATIRSLLSVKQVAEDTNRSVWSQSPIPPAQYNR